MLHQCIHILYVKCISAFIYETAIYIYIKKKNCKIFKKYKLRFHDILIYKKFKLS